MPSRRPPKLNELSSGDGDPRRVPLWVNRVPALRAIR
jgi:hypothetical protein